MAHAGGFGGNRPGGGGPCQPRRLQPSGGQILRRGGVQPRFHSIGAGVTAFRIAGASRRASSWRLWARISWISTPPSRAPLGRMGRRRPLVRVRRPPCYFFRGRAMPLPTRTCLSRFARRLCHARNLEAFSRRRSFLPCASARRTTGCVGSLGWQLRQRRRHLMKVPWATFPVMNGQAWRRITILSTMQGAARAIRACCTKETESIGGNREIVARRRGRRFR